MWSLQGGSSPRAEPDEGLSLSHFPSLLTERALSNALTHVLCCRGSLAGLDTQGAACAGVNVLGVTTESSQMRLAVSLDGKEWELGGDQEGNICFTRFQVREEGSQRY